jgi:DNA-binding NtrC family response regulator
MGKPALTVSETALERLRGYLWPGNVRELRNVMDRAVVLCTGSSILAEHVVLGRVAPSEESSPVAASSRRSRENEPMSPPAALPDAVAALERERIVAALDSTGGNQTAAARLLGISRRTLVYRIKAYGIPRSKRTP